MAPGFVLRAAVPADVAALTTIVVEGFHGYRCFAPPGWTPPAAAGEREALARHIGTPEVWCLMAERDGAAAGHVSFLPAPLSHRGSADHALVHLWQLFVRPPHWGTGLARELLARAVAEAAGRGFAAMRLFTPAAQVRARRFYEREGWTAGEPFDDETFGMALVEYRRPLAA